MCGIVGIIHKEVGRTCSKDALIAMRDVITHRGPDDKGSFFEGNLALGHRRLSIIDLSAGHQPMFADQENLVIVFNGEIYNYLELRRELEKRGFEFQTHSDTEVILQLYRKYGENCVDYLNGIFAFAIWDKAEKGLFLARDHIGIKPLYYYQDRDTLLFASEVKSLFASGLVQSESRVDLLPEYLIFRQIAGEDTLFKDIYALLPGHCMSIKDGKVKIRQYWDSLNSQQNHDLSFNDAKEQLSSLLVDAVKMQMMSDVPLGTFCSGGIDSSLVTAIAAQHSNKAINTFSVGFHEQEYDETKFARMVSQRYGTQHHEIKLNEKEFTELLPKMVWYNDEPLNFANSIHIYAISTLAKNHVTVVLTGEGSDELFAGYPRYQIPRIVGKLQILPGLVKWLMSGVMALSSDHRLVKLRSYLKTPVDNAVLYNSSAIGLKNILTYWPDIKMDRFQYRTEVMKKVGESADQIERVSKLDQNSYLVSILNRQDKMSMAASIESRVPFLDYRLIEFANALPVKYKIRGVETKYILKVIAEQHLPKEVIYRKKSGFGVPLPIWLRSDNEFGKLAKDALLGSNNPELDQYIDTKKLFHMHQNGKQDHSEILWSALNYVLWKKAFNISPQ